MATQLEYKVFKATHKQWKGDYWHLCEQHARGGGEVMSDAAFMEAVLRRNLVEDEAVWRERSARAVIKPYGAEIIGQLAATVFGDPLTIQIEAGEGDEPTKPDDEWAAWLENTARPGAPRPVPFADHMRKVLDRCLVDGIAYTLVDFMRQSPGEPAPASLAHADAMGLSWPYLVEVDPCAVTQWSDDDYGDLRWAVIKSTSCERTKLTDPDNMVTERYHVLGRTDWSLWAITYDRNRYPQGPGDSEMVTLADSGPHSFGRVPLVRHRVPNNLWAMDRMFPLLNDIVRGSSGYSWVRDKTNCPTPFLKLQNLKTSEETPDSTVEQQGVGRGKSGPMKAGEIAILGERDELGWSAPGVESLAEAREGVDATRTELYRVMDAMAQAIDPSASSNKQSGESKAMDATSKAILARALGKTPVREGAEDILRMVEAGRGAEATEWAIGGCDEVETETAADAVLDLGALELVTLPPLVRELELDRFMRLRGYSEKQREQARKQMQEVVAVDHEAAQAEAGARAAIAEEIVKPKPAAKPPGKAAK